MSTVTITGLAKIVNNLRTLGNNVEQIVDKSLEESSVMLEGKVKDKITAVGAVDTGAMREDTKAKKLGICRYAVVCPKAYAVFIEYGVGSLGDPAVAHNVSDITARIDKVTGKAKLVHFAPRAPRPFMRPAFAENRDVIMQNTRRAIIEAYDKELRT